jgi:transcription factor STE12
MGNRSNLFHISGTDIVRCLAFRFQAFGRPVRNSKKFEEGIFSDLRNLKAGTDATLEEPKSPFLDFLYKNNCIRTQKKQKVFYWYSVPHDRLFLDALERDLKREKMGQDPTTVAVSEPAMSFEFDSSQSLYEQLTKAQQANSSSFAANASTTYGQSASPVVRTVDAMPPPQMATQMAPPSIPFVPDDSGNPAMYNAVPMPSTLGPAFVKREQDYGPIQYDRNGMPIARVHQRHASMPTFAEYSPAPSFVSSQYEDYSNRGLSYEPVTPPQHSVPLGAEPAYIANEDTGLYTAIPDISSAAAFNPMMQLPQSNLASAHFPAPPRTFPSSVYSAIEGSPTYKQRRRRSSLTPGVPNPIAAATANAPVQSAAVPASHPMAYAAHRPSDLRRSVSSSVAPAVEGDEHTHDSSRRVTNSYPPAVLPQKDLLHEMSPNGTPLSHLEENPDQNSLPLANPHDDLAGLPNGDALEATVQSSVTGKTDRQGPGPVRRARSATTMELGPYPQKSHSCPIPSCARLFKRLEHLKR